jgi:hypothetical protein
LWPVVLLAMLAPAALARAEPPARVTVGAVGVGVAPNGLRALLVPVHYPTQLTGRVVETRVQLLDGDGSAIRSWTLHERLANGRFRHPTASPLHAGKPGGADLGAAADLRLGRPLAAIHGVGRIRHGRLICGALERLPAARKSRCTVSRAGWRATRTPASSTPRSPSGPPGDDTVDADLVKNTNATIYLMQYHLSAPSNALAYSATPLQRRHRHHGRSTPRATPARASATGQRYKRAVGPDPERAGAASALPAKAGWTANPLRDQRRHRIHPSAAGYAQMVSRVPPPG